MSVGKEGVGGRREGGRKERKTRGHVTWCVRRLFTKQILRWYPVYPGARKKNAFLADTSARKGGVAIFCFFFAVNRKILRTRALYR